MQDLRNLTLVLWRRWLLLVTATILGGGLALASMIQIGMFPNYSATAIVAIGGDVYYSTQESAYLELADSMIENYRRLASLEIVTSAAAKNLNSSLSANEMAKLLDVSLIADSHLIAIKATHEQPQMAAAIANEVARQLMQLAPPQERNFVLLVETAVTPTIPDISAIIPVMMTAIAAFLATMGGLLFSAYVKQPILSEADLSEFVIPTIGTIDASGTDVASEWWMVKRACEAQWAKQERAPRHLLLTSPSKNKDLPTAAAQLAAVWQLDSHIEGDVAAVAFARVSDFLPANFLSEKRPFLQTTQTIIDTALTTAESASMTIFYSQLPENMLSILMMMQHVDMALLLVPIGNSFLPELEDAAALLNSDSAQMGGIVLVRGRLHSRWRGWVSLFQRIWEKWRLWRNGRSTQPVDSQPAVESGGTS